MKDKELHDLFENQPSESFQAKAGKKPEASPKKQKSLRQYSLWYHADLLICFLLFLNFGGMFYKYFSYFVMLAMPAALVILTVKPLYEKNKETPKYMKTITAILRSLIYTVLLAVIILPYTMGLDIPWYYPVQRAMFLSNYGEDSILQEFLPKSIPTDAEAYSFSCSPSMGQGSSYMHLCFYTDAENIQEFRKNAENYGAQHCSAADMDAEKWISFMENHGADTENAEVYIFYEGYSNSAVYMLNESTGYFELYW